MDTLEKVAQDYGLTPDGVRYALSQYQKVIEELKRVKARVAFDEKTVVHGRWEFDAFTAKYGNPYHCSICKEEHNDTYNYCPNCGAMMDLTEG